MPMAMSAQKRLHVMIIHKNYRNEKETEVDICGMIPLTGKEVMKYCITGQ